MKNIKTIIVVISISLIAIVTRVFWLTILLSLPLLFYLFVSYFNNLEKKNWRTKSFKTIVSFVFCFLIAISVRVFLFEIFAIPSGSMENTLLPGDKILVNKTIYGPQLPQSPLEIPWANIFFYLTSDNSTKLDSVWWKSRRLKGLSNIKRNDVLVFKNEPLAPGNFIKRCVAIPGDDLQIINSNLYVNGDYATSNSLGNVRKEYIVNAKNSLALRGLVDSLGIYRYVYDNPRTMGVLKMSLTKSEVDTIGMFDIVDSIVVDVENVDSTAWLYPYCKRKIWSMDNYGPIKVPYKGWTIHLNDPIATMYFDIISKWENTFIENRNGHYYLDDEEIVQYTFLYDYYFMMGDNRYNSIDSRMWGFIPEYKIIGKATNIVWSNNDYGFKWSRIFKKIL